MTSCVFIIFFLNKCWTLKCLHLIYAFYLSLFLSIFLSLFLGSGTSCKFAAKSDRIVEACPILCVSEKHHWTLQSQQELQSEYVLSCWFLFFLRIPGDISACPDLTPLFVCNQSQSWRVARVTEIFDWPWVPPCFSVCKCLIRMLTSTHLREPKVLCEIVSSHTYLLFATSYTPAYICMSIKPFLFLIKLTVQSWHNMKSLAFFVSLYHNTCSFSYRLSRGNSYEFTRPCHFPESLLAAINHLQQCETFGKICSAN